MLINGATIGYSTTKDGDYTDIPGWKTSPGFSGNPQKIDNSIINSDFKHYELGQKDPGDLTFGFSYGTDAEKEAFFKFREYDVAGTRVYFQVTMKDDTKVKFDGSVAASFMPSGGGPDTPTEWGLTVGLQSDFEYIKPTPAAG